MYALDDDEELEWQALAICQGLGINAFFDDYESDPEVARNTDDICLSCPVRALCAAEAVQKKLTVCWGGIYFTNGRLDMARNEHKTPDIWEKVKSFG